MRYSMLPEWWKIFWDITIITNSLKFWNFFYDYSIFMKLTEWVKNNEKKKKLKERIIETIFNNKQLSEMNSKDSLL